MRAARPRSDQLKEETYMTRLKTCTGLGAVLAALTAAPVLAQDISEWDTGGDGMIDQAEFTEGFDAFDPYPVWDSDSSGTVSEQEFDAGVTASYDADMSGDMSEEEQMAVDESAWAAQDYSDWDADASGDLSSDEIGQGMFKAYDSDGDGNWTEEDYQTFRDENPSWFEA